MTPFPYLGQNMWNFSEFSKYLIQKDAIQTDIHKCIRILYLPAKKDILSILLYLSKYLKYM